MPATLTAEAPTAEIRSGQPRTLVTVATYNEIENLPRLVEAAFQVAPHADLLVIDEISETPAEN